MTELDWAKTVGAVRKQERERRKILNPKPELRSPKGAKPKLRNSERELRNLELRNSGRNLLEGADCPASFPTFLSS
jgi:hypothetical protein